MYAERILPGVVRCFSLLTLGIALCALMGCSLVRDTPSSNDTLARPTRTRAGPAASQPQRPTGSPNAPSAVPEPTSNEDDTVSADLTVPQPSAAPAHLPPGRTRVFGIVTAPDDSPVVGAVVTIPRASAQIPEIALFTNAKGEYNWGLPPGLYTFQVNGTGYKPARAEADTRQNIQVELNFKLEPE